ncbi:hypothetical protein [Tunicatimonas pelagia]|uniref:hypothetical protein n=1 Tax=Tunicatimonas pelagia TaxID=931531 RepID=UPI002664E45E|nr:hypothetical protein [Tunicatimonas pelagia]WKN45193.1 hypothetical protein P0M28_09500 [Tunicatimonas pelagia]
MEKNIAIKESKMGIEAPLAIYRIFDGCLFASVIDSLGQGTNAWKITQHLRNTMLENYDLNLECILKKCEQAIRKNYPNSGAALGLLNIRPGQLSYLADGDATVLASKVFQES